MFSLASRTSGRPGGSAAAASPSASARPSRRTSARPVPAASTCSAAPRGAVAGQRERVADGVRPRAGRQAGDDRQVAQRQPAGVAQVHGRAGDLHAVQRHAVHGRAAAVLGTCVGDVGGEALGVQDGGGELTAEVAVCRAGPAGRCAA